MQHYGREHRGRKFLMRIILGNLAGQTPEEFAKQEMDIIEARNEPLKLCEHGWPTGLCWLCKPDKKGA